MVGRREGGCGPGAGGLRSAACLWRRTSTTCDPRWSCPAATDVVLLRPEYQATAIPTAKPTAIASTYLAHPMRRPYQGANAGTDALGRIRTCDAGLRRAALYPLSYEGIRHLA